MGSSRRWYTWRNEKILELAHAHIVASTHARTHTACGCVTTQLHGRAAGDLFTALDSYLKSQKVRFQELFQSFDADGSGALDNRELGRLVRELMPTTTEAELRYFQVRLSAVVV
jgi:hypothetical protein